MKDRQHVDRGKCRKPGCHCQEYIVNAGETKCAMCKHTPVAHATGGVIRLGCTHRGCHCTRCKGSMLRCSICDHPRLDHEIKRPPRARDIFKTLRKKKFSVDFRDDQYIVFYGSVGIQRFLEYISSVLSELVPQIENQWEFSTKFVDINRNNINYATHLVMQTACRIPSGDVPNVLNCVTDMPGAVLDGCKDIVFFYDRNSPYYQFTNFFKADFTLDGDRWPTSEHYFQAQKFRHHPYHMKAVRRLHEPREAFQYSRDHHELVDPMWHSRKDDVMEVAVREKFKQNTHLKELLLSTGSALLVEHTENDDYWGDGGRPGKGKNMLGSTLIKVRKFLGNRRDSFDRPLLNSPSAEEFKGDEIDYRSDNVEDEDKPTHNTEIFSQPDSSSDDEDKLVFGGDERKVWNPERKVTLNIDGREWTSVSEYAMQHSQAGIRMSELPGIGKELLRRLRVGYTALFESNRLERKRLTSSDPALQFKPNNEWKSKELCRAVGRVLMDVRSDFLEQSTGAKSTASSSRVDSSERAINEREIKDEMDVDNDDRSDFKDPEEENDSEVTRSQGHESGHESDHGNDVDEQDDRADPQHEKATIVNEVGREDVIDVTNLRDEGGIINVNDDSKENEKNVDDQTKSSHEDVGTKEECKDTENRSSTTKEVDSVDSGRENCGMIVDNVGDNELPAVKDETSMIDDDSSDSGSEV